MGMAACAVLAMILPLRGADTDPLVIETKAADLAVVKTLDDLKKQPVIAVEGIATRVGIEAAECGAGTGVLVYCLWDPTGFKEPIWKRGGNASPLGPFRVRAVSVGGPNIMDAQIEEKLAQQAVTGPITTVSGVVIPEAGKYAIEVFTIDGAVVARGVVEGKENKEARWLSVELRDEQWDKERTSGQAVLAPGMMAVAPSWENVAIKGDALPRFLPAKASDQMRLKADGGSLVLTMKPDGVSPDAQHFAARWWVNGVGVVATGGPDARALQEQLREVERDADIQLTWKLDGLAERLKAKAGDSVEVEVLFGSEEMVPASDGAKVMMRLERLTAGKSAPVRLSNRVKFTMAKP